MAIQNIVHALEQSQILTTQERDSLKSLAAPNAFLKKITEIFEAKVEQYLASCVSMVKRTCIVQKISTPADSFLLDESMRAALGVFLQVDEVSCVSSIKELLQPSQKELLTSLALATTTPDGVDISSIAKKVFVGYTARYRLFQMVDVHDLAALCQASSQEAGEETVFPSYLLNALQIEKTLSIAIKTAKSQVAANQYPELKCAILQANQEHLADAARGIIFYLESLVSVESIEAGIRSRYFRHLQTPETKLEFAQLMSVGYCQSLFSEKAIEPIANANRLTSEKVHHICMPALSYLGLALSVDDSIFQQQVTAIKQAIDQNRQNGAEFSRQVAQAKAQAHADIDAWRRSIPQRPFTIYVQAGGIQF